MVKLKYAALYTDDLGCEQATVYFLKGEFHLEVRGFTFKSDNLNFEFYTKNSNKLRRLFYIKDDELIEYVIDIKIPLIVVNNNKEHVEEFLLRVERHKNYYNNSLSFYSKDVVYTVEGYNLQELLINMKKALPKEYNMKSSFSDMFETYYMDLFNIENKKRLKKLQKVPVTYICGDYCLS